MSRFKSRSFKIDTLVKLYALAERGHRSMPEQVAFLADEEIERLGVEISDEEYETRKERLEALSK